MRRRDFIIFVGGVAVAAPLTVRAERPATTPRVGMLIPLSAAVSSPLVEAFRQALAERGHVEGRSIAIAYRYADGKLDPLAAMAEELVRLRVDVIVTVGAVATRAAQRATSEIPIVMATSGDAVGSGLVASLARPGGNVTGLSFLGLELSAKYLELIKETIPHVARVAILWNSTVHPAAQKETQKSAAMLGATLQLLEARVPHEYNEAFLAMIREGAEALIVFPVVPNFENRSLIADLAAKNRLPAIYGQREHVEVGGLMSYGPSFSDLFRRAAVFVDKILKGAKPANLPVEQPTTFELVINLKTAEALSLTIPDSVLVRADEVIE